jgi:hypothetical protein
MRSLRMVRKFAVGRQNPLQGYSPWPQENSLAEVISKMRTGDHS